tara:strand:- start:510 stop:959 length:450 start_codon:yes stop_codon:yes gene_type:complete
MKLTKSQLKEMIREELKLTEDFKNSEWEVYVADENGKEKIMKVAKSKRAGVILYNKLINSDKYHEVGMRVKGYKEGIGEGKLDEVGINVSSKPFAAWREHSDYIRKLNRDSSWAAKSFPNKKKEAKQIQKLTQELYKLIEIIKGQAIDL